MQLIRARIDRAALRSNLAVIRSRAPRARIMAMVKANAYGHGLVSTALALPDADAFAVARIEEAQALRNAGIAQRIVLLEGIQTRAQLTMAAELQLDLVVHEFGQIELLEAWQGVLRFSLWLKIDTGMNRLGFPVRDFASAWKRLNALRPAPAELRVLTHLSCADEPANPANARQLAQLAPLIRGLNVEVSIANSAALLDMPETHAQWVRPGLALYGVSPFAGKLGTDFGLKAVMTLESTVLAVRELAVGEAVGYGATWRAARPSRIAILAGGYGDGLLRSIPNGAQVLLNDQRVPLTGRVSMDMIAVDVTELPSVAVGDRAELWGTKLPVEQLATAAGTIPYELLCGVSQRVPLELE